MYAYDNLGFGTTAIPFIYTGHRDNLKGTGYDGFITDCVGTGNDTGCTPSADTISSGFYNTVALLNDSCDLKLPSGTCFTASLDGGTYAYRIDEYCLPQGTGCDIITSNSSLYFYPRTFADASAGQIVLDLPLSTASDRDWETIFIYSISIRSTI